MFVFLSKFLTQFVYPLGLGWMLLLLVLFLLRRSAGLAWAKRLLWVVVILLWLGGNQWVSASLTRSLEWRNLPPTDLPQGALVVVLGGGTEAQQYPRMIPEVGSAGDRVIYALKLYQDGVADKLLLSGGNITWLGAGSSSGAEEMAVLLQMMGVPADRLILQEESRNTYEDALFCSQIARDLGVSQIILVTSASHMPRSRALFEKQGLLVIPAPADFGVTEASWQNLWHPSFEELLVHLLPNASDLAATQTAMKEYIGIVVYNMRGWL